MTGEASLLETADRLLREVVPGTRGLWPRTVAFLARAAVEHELAGFWARVQPEVAAAPMRAQLLLLGQYAGPEVARDAADAWGGLSRACHHHAYELAPTAPELREWLTTVQRVAGALAGCRAAGDPPVLSDPAATLGERHRGRAHEEALA